MKLVSPKGLTTKSAAATAACALATLLLLQGMDVPEKKHGFAGWDTRNQKALLVFVQLAVAPFSKSSTACQGRIWPLRSCWGCPGDPFPHCGRGQREGSHLFQGDGELGQRDPTCLSPASSECTEAEGFFLSPFSLHTFSFSHNKEMVVDFVASSDGCCGDGSVCRTCPGLCPPCFVW